MCKIKLNELFELIIYYLLSYNSHWYGNMYTTKATQGMENLLGPWFKGSGHNTDFKLQ